MVIQNLTTMDSVDDHQRTGILPQNSETPPDILYEKDITPTEHCYVRNHGVPPDLTWEEHRLEFYTKNTFKESISMDNLKTKFRPVSFPVTVVCDGNRRKELNVIKRTNGFDWGPCAASTILFKGILLRDLLLTVFSEKELDNSSHVLFESADKLFKGYYGTSVLLSAALDEQSDILVAYGMNSQKLTKNHGFPVRTVLPGCVGGRTVKWLKKIILSDTDSDNKYHLGDNSVFPQHVTSTALMSQTIGEYSKEYTKNLGPPRTRHPFILYELNVNSVILFPQHGETLNIQDLDSSCDFKGYAYDGGGRKIIRIEITLDKGQSWLPCNISYPDDYSPRHGHRWYVMCKWSISVPLWKLGSCTEVTVRAWNSSFNTQPSDANWNILGMMNNCHYTVHPMRDDARKIQVLHPVSLKPNDPKGWMEMQKTVPVRYSEKSVPPVVYSREEVSKHNRVSDCWVIIDDKVYDLTDFVNMHPGGSSSLVAHAGTDVTVPFYNIHSDDTHVFKAAYAIGRVGDGDERKEDEKERYKHQLLAKKHPKRTPDGKEVSLNPAKWVSVTLQKKISLNHDTRRFVFTFGSAEKRMWLPWGKHVNIGVELSDRMVVRPYTPVKPVTSKEDDGTFELVIKIYFPTEDRPGGEMTQILERLNVGDQVLVKGPEGVLWYLGHGQWVIHGHFFYCDKMNFIVGGTGITPALAVMRAVILSERKPYKINLVFANKTLEDIICKEELKELLSAESGNLQICHVIDDKEFQHVGIEAKKVDRISYEKGRVRKEIFEKYIIPATEGSCCFLCGPPAMIAKAVLPALGEMGFDDDQIYEF